MQVEGHVSTVRRKVNGQVWGKSQRAVSRFLFGLSPPKAVVLDCFAGEGSILGACKLLGRHYLAFEIDPDIAELARERVRNTQPPLFVMEPEQLELL
jgi:site-specific DNA-methyltransferase (adenine-specific)